MPRWLGTHSPRTTKGPAGYASKDAYPAGPVSSARGGYFASDSTSMPSTSPSPATREFQLSMTARSVGLVASETDDVDHGRGDQAVVDRFVGKMPPNFSSAWISSTIMVPSVTTVPAAIDAAAPMPLPRFHIRPPMIATSRPPTRMS